MKNGTTGEDTLQDVAVIALNLIRFGSPMSRALTTHAARWPGHVSQSGAIPSGAILIGEA
jgi:hypothetical protein